jgi:hypothetical protein
MDKKLISVAEAFIKLNESLLRMVLAVNRAKRALEKILRMKYEAAGYPFGDTEEGLLLWRDYLSKKYAVQSGENGPLTVQKHEHVEFSDHNFDRLEEEIRRRVN